MEFWTSSAAMPSRMAEYAKQAEAIGWDGLSTVDSQNLSGDPYVSLAMAATATARLGLMTGVTNVATRAAAVTATAALSVQKVSNNRMVLGIGRGDSALAHLGRAPAHVRWFENYLAVLQAYLRGEEVDFDRAGILDAIAPKVENLGLADTPTSSAIHWAAGMAKVPVEVASTGEKVIGIAARHADRIMFALGANPDRISWGMETARAAADKSGRDPDSLQYGAYVNLVCHDNLKVAREIGRAGTSLFARFSVMHGKVSGPADESQMQVFKNVHDRYDMNKHAQAGGGQTTALTDEFMDSYAIVGPAPHCVERLEELHSLGIEKFAITGPNFISRQPEAVDAANNFVEEVMDKLRG